MTELVVGLAFLWILQDLVGFPELLEALLGLFVAGVAIGMELQGELAIRGLDFIHASAAIDLQDLVVIAFRHNLSGQNLFCGKNLPNVSAPTPPVKSRGGTDSRSRPTAALPGR